MAATSNPNLATSENTPENLAGVRQMVRTFIREADVNGNLNAPTTADHTFTADDLQELESFETVFTNLVINVYQDPRYYPEVQKLLLIVERRFLGTGQLVQACFKWLFEICKNIGEKLCQLIQNKWIQLALFLLVSALVMLAARRMGISFGLGESGLIRYVANFISPELAYANLGQPGAGAASFSALRALLGIFSVPRLL